MTNRVHRVASFFLTFALVAVGTARSQTIFAPSASTIYQDGNQIATGFEFVSGQPNSPTSVPVTIVYGPGPSFTTALTIPYLNRDTRGIGDIGVTLKYRSY